MRTPNKISVFYFRSFVYFGKRALVIFAKYQIEKYIKFYSVSKRIKIQKNKEKEQVFILLSLRNVHNYPRHDF